MLADRKGEVRVRASFDGSVDLLVKPGARVYPGQGLVVVEGDRELEKLSARNSGRITEVLVKDGQEVQKGTVLLVLLEDATS